VGVYWVCWMFFSGGGSGPRRWLICLGWVSSVFEVRPSGASGAVSRGIWWGAAGEWSSVVALMRSDAGD